MLFMKVVLYELRKIFDWKIIATTMVFCFVFYFIFIRFEFRHYPNGPNQVFQQQVALQMIEAYGVEINAQELEELKEVQQREIQRFNEYIGSRIDFQEAGIKTYEQYRTTESELGQQLSHRLAHEEQLDLSWELQERAHLIERYETREWWLLEGTERQQERQLEIWNREEQAILPGFVLENYQQIITYTAMMIILSIVIVLAPVYIKERKNHLFLLQYSTKLGRNLFYKKILASVLTALMIITLELAVIFFLYAGNQTSAFFAVEINSIFIWGHLPFYWLNITFGQYILLTIGFVYVLGVMIALLVMFFSRLAPNYLTVIGIQIPLIGVLFGWLFNYLVQTPFHIDFPIFITPLLYGTCISICVALIFFQGKKEQRVDI